MSIYTCSRIGYLSLIQLGIMKQYWGHVWVQLYHHSRISAAGNCSYFKFHQEKSIFHSVYGPQAIIYKRPINKILLIPFKKSLIHHNTSPHFSLTESGWELLLSGQYFTNRYYPKCNFHKTNILMKSAKQIHAITFRFKDEKGLQFCNLDTVKTK